MITRDTFEALNLELIAARKAVEERDRILDLMAVVDEELAQKRAEAAILEVRRQHEKMDVEELENTSIAALLFGALGKREAVLAQQAQEYLTAKLAYDQCQRRVATLQNNLRRLEEQLVSLADCDTEYQSLLRQQKQALLQLKTPNAERLQTMINTLAKDQLMAQEVAEAQHHGREAHTAIHQVQERLRQMTGPTMRLRGSVGRLLADSIAAQTALDNFERELRDIDQHFWQNHDPQMRELADSPFSFIYLAARLLDAVDDAQRLKLWRHHMGKLHEHLNQLLEVLDGRAAALQTDISRLESETLVLIDIMWQPGSFLADESG